MKLFIIMVAALYSMASFADQCAWNKRTDAKSAVKLIKNNDIILWCQNCAEKKPSNIFKVTDIKTDKPANNYYEVTVSTDKAGTNVNIDLAYTYVRTASDIFTNVAQLVGCPSQGATTFIQTGPGLKKTAHHYNKSGKRVDVVMVEGEIKVADFMTATATDRMPASTK